MGTSVPDQSSAERSETCPPPGALLQDEPTKGELGYPVRRSPTKETKVASRIRITGPLNGTRLAEAVAAEMGISRREGKRAVEAVLGIIARSVAGGHPVNVTNFGTWIPVQVDERTARNPATGEPVVVPARQELRFRQSPRLQELVREADPETATIRKYPKP
jgi:DNA-binding protein HU-beta